MWKKKAGGKQGCAKLNRNKFSSWQSQSACTGGSLWLRVTRKSVSSLSSSSLTQCTSPHPLFSVALWKKIIIKMYVTYLSAATTTTTKTIRCSGDTKAVWYCIIICSRVKEMWYHKQTLFNMKKPRAQYCAPRLSVSPSPCHSSMTPERFFIPFYRISLSFSIFKETYAVFTFHFGVSLGKSIMVCITCSFFVPLFLQRSFCVPVIRSKLMCACIEWWEGAMMADDTEWIRQKCI